MLNTEEQNIKDEILKLKRERNAVILAHNYQLGEIQDLADFCGDSLGLSLKLKDIDADVIVFCGVKFMAETAAVISPEKKVVLPVMDAGCLMADMATAEDLRKMKDEHPNATVVCYVNSTAEVKTESDLCCTSSNVLDIVRKIPSDREIIFVPDRNLGAYVADKLNREIILWPGYCPTHNRITAEILKKRKKEFPNAKVIVHPESRLDVIKMADEALSTGGMLKYASESNAEQIIVGTESGIIHRLQKENPDKQFIAVSEQAICPDMKMIRCEDVLRSLKTMTKIISISPETRKKALAPIKKMMAG